MLRISDLARSSGVGVETVRFYQRKSLLDTPRATARAGRHYGDEDLHRLRYIRHAQAAGFTLAEIGELIELDRTDDRARARDLARERIAALDEEITRLGKARDSLAKLAKDCEKTGAGPCPILAAFD